MLKFFRRIRKHLLESGKIKRFSTLAHKSEKSDYLGTQDFSDSQCYGEILKLKELRIIVSLKVLN